MRIFLFRAGNFVVEKIDMKIFVTLTGEDLRELKINAFGARKRLLLAIQVNRLIENRTKSIFFHRINNFSGFKG